MATLMMVSWGECGKLFSHQRIHHGLVNRQENDPDLKTLQNLISQDGSFDFAGCEETLSGSAAKTSGVTPLLTQGGPQ